MQGRAREQWPALQRWRTNSGPGRTQTLGFLTAQNKGDHTLYTQP